MNIKSLFDKYKKEGYESYRNCMTKLTLLELAQDLAERERLYADAKKSIEGHLEQITNLPFPLRQIFKRGQNQAYVELMM